MKTAQLWLKVEEAERILLALLSAKRSRRLDDRQRQLLEDAFASLTEMRSKALRGRVKIPAESALLLLRCIAFVQESLDGLFPDFGG